MSRLHVGMAVSALILWGFCLVYWARDYQVPIELLYITWCSGFLLGSWKETTFIDK